MTLSKLAWWSTIAGSCVSWAVACGSDRAEDSNHDSGVPSSAGSGGTGSAGATGTTSSTGGGGGNHGGAAGASGHPGAAGQAGSTVADASTGGDGSTDPNACHELETDYDAAFTEAKKCSLGSAVKQCQASAYGMLHCMTCLMPVQDATTLDGIRARWTAARCQGRPPPCPGFGGPCPSPALAQCAAVAGLGTCVSTVR
jgi:hypothetical protein